MIAACIGASVKGIHAQREFCYQAGRGNWVYFYLALMRVPPPPQMSTFAAADLQVVPKPQRIQHNDQIAILYPVNSI